MCQGVVTAAPDESASADDEDWLQLFNGVDLEGWTPKIVGEAAGSDKLGTFSVRDGVLKVGYQNYDVFDGRFGHLFYDIPYSYYRLRIEYRFVGDQAPGGPGGWAVRNSGVMVHSQSVTSMLLEQAFPLSVEAQFLGGLGDGEPRPTANVCTPGTDIVFNGSIHPHHCLYSGSPTLDGDQWVRFEMLVLGSGQLSHYVNGARVLEYVLPQFGGSGVARGFDPAIKKTGDLLAGGFIALQSESHPIEFRLVELLDLEGCMDKSSPRYRRYFVKSDPERCIGALQSESDQAPADGATD
jgi:hypothetical protein